MGFGSIALFFFLIYASIQWFPKRGQAVLMGIANSIGMVGWIALNRFTQYVNGLFGIELSICVLLILTLYMGMIIYSLLKKGPKNKVPFSRAFILVLKDKVCWCFGLVSIGFYAATFIFATTWGYSFFMEVYGLSKETTDFFSNLVFLGLGIGGPCVGYLSDKFSRRKVFIVALNVIALSSIGGMLYFSPLPVVLLGVLSFVIGVCSSGYLLLYTLAIDYNHPKIRGATALFISLMLLIGSVVVESQLEFPFLFLLLATTGLFALRINDPPPEMEQSKETLEKLFSIGEKISNS